MPCRSAASVAAFVLALSAAMPAFAELFGTITILEGDALVYRNTGRLQAAEGARLMVGDLIDVGAKGAMQVETPDRTLIQVGARTRAMLSAGPGRGKAERSLYLLDGWVKASGARRDKSASGVEMRTPLVEIAPAAGVAVLQSSAQQVAVFAESGEVRVTERTAGSPLVAVKTDQLYRRKVDAKGVIDPTAMRAFIAEMPPIFRDTLPSRLDKYKGVETAMKAAPEFSYADVEAWLKSEPAVRRQFVQRWRPKTRDSAFRAGLVANLAAHPEWDPILFPEKYQPKPQDGPAPTADAAGRPHDATSAPR